MYKFLNFISIYLLSIINFAILLVPLGIVFVPIMFSGIPLEKKAIISFVLLLFFIVNVIVLLAAFMDLLFGFTTKSYVRATIPYLKLKNYDMLTAGFEEIKTRFQQPSVQLRISDSQDINAFAVGNFSKKYIVLTKGIVTEYLMNARGNIPVFLDNIKCIMGHEMSHLINKDYLPALLLRLNELAGRFISNIIIKILNIFINLVSYIPFVGRLIAMLITYFYKLIDFVIMFFHKYILLTLYNFFQLKISRVNEYRCDTQSSFVCGGANMARTLAVLGDSGYVTIFSTHPSTKSRMKHVNDIKKTQDYIDPIKANKFANTFAILLIMFFPLIIWKFIDIKLLGKNYNDIILNIVTRFRMLKITIFSKIGLEN